MKWNGGDLLIITGPVLAGDDPTSIRRLCGGGTLATREGL
jgi:hypothetical protein